MATHSSILAWRIPWTEEPGGLYSMGHKELNMTEHTRNIKGMVSATPWLRPCTLDNHIFGCE